MFSRLRQIFKKGKIDKYAFFKQGHIVSKIIPSTPSEEKTVPYPKFRHFCKIFAFFRDLPTVNGPG